MELLTKEQMERMQELACARLEPLGWEPRGWMVFAYGGRVYDLSAADLGQLARIVAEGLFIVAE